MENISGPDETFPSKRSSQECLMELERGRIAIRENGTVESLENIYFISASVKLFAFSFENKILNTLVNLLPGMFDGLETQRCYARC